MHILYETLPRGKALRTKLEPQRKVVPNTGMAVRVVNHPPENKRSYLAVWRFFVSIFYRRNFFWSALFCLKTNKQKQTNQNNNSENPRGKDIVRTLLLLGLEGSNKKDFF